MNMHEIEHSLAYFHMHVKCVVPKGRGVFSFLTMQSEMDCKFNFYLKSQSFHFPVTNFFFLQIMG